MTVNALCEKELGFDTKTIVRHTYFITDAFDINIFEQAKHNYSKAVLLTYAAFLWICVTSDRVHAYVDGGILPSPKLYSFSPLELFVYRLLKIKLFIWTYGGDVRTEIATKALGDSNCCMDCPEVGTACVCSLDSYHENYKKVSRVAKAIFSMGDMIEYTPESHNDLYFWPVDLQRNNGEHYRPIYPCLINNSPKPLKIVHAPNHRHFKGTKYLVSAVEKLKKEGIIIELILVEKTPNNIALSIYKSADIVFDQCLIGFHGYFAIEAMALGKPVICYIRKPKEYMLNHQDCPIINTKREDLLTTIRYYATTGRNQLGDIGRSSRKYVEKHYSMSAFTDRLKNKYNKLGVGL